MADERYRRQDKTFDQQKLLNSSLLIYGSGYTARHIAMISAFLGVGLITIVDDKKVSKGDMLLDMSLSDFGREYTAEAIADAIRILNPDSEGNPVPQGFCSGTINLGRFHDVVIHATNNSIQKEQFFIAYERHDLRFDDSLIFTANSELECRLNVMNSKRQWSVEQERQRLQHRSDRCLPEDRKRDIFTMDELVTGEAAVTYKRSALFQSMDGLEENLLMSWLAAGIAQGEIVKLLMGKKDRMLGNEAIVNLRSLSHYGDKIVDSRKLMNYNPNDFKDFSVAVVGCGSAGEVGAYLTLEQLRPKTLYLVDYDSFEESNRNRQWAAYDPGCVGRSKAAVTAERLEKIAREKGYNTKIVTINSKFTEDFEFPEKVDAVFDATDGMQNKILVHYWCIRNKVSGVSVGTSALNASGYLYIPKATGCFEHQFGIRSKALYSGLLDMRPRCADNDGWEDKSSNIITNAIGAAQMVMELMCILRPDKYGPTIQGHYQYDLLGEGQNPVKRVIGVTPIVANCRCKGDTLEKFVLPDETRVTYDMSGANPIVSVDGAVIKW